MAGSRRWAWPQAVSSLALLAPGVVAFHPTFGEVIGVVAPAAGVLVGVGLAFLARGLGWPWWRTMLAVVIAYFVLGGAVALPRTTMAGVVPTPDTLMRLLLLTVQGWRDLLTVSVPAGDFVGPAVVPWLAGLIAGDITFVLAARAHNPWWAVLPPLGWLGVAIAFGPRTVPHAVWLGAAFGLLALAWVLWRRRVAEVAANADILLRTPPRSVGVRRTLAGLAALTLAAGASIGAQVANPAWVDRLVLRDYVAPPLQLAAYASPLMRYRYYEVDQKQDVLWTITGMPSGERLRLATLDTFDGNVYNVAQDSSSYVRVGQRFGRLEQTGTPVTLSVKTGAYTGVWVPLVGTPTGLAFTSDNGFRRADGLHVNRFSQTALTTSGLADGDTFTVSGLVTPPLTAEQREALTGRRAGGVTLPAPDNVPPTLGAWASDTAAEEASPYAQLAAIEQRLREDGFYSDGTDGKSRSGHTTERLTSLLAGRAIVGDDEQYAVAMALMARELNIPARVVLGFYPRQPLADGAEWQVVGTEAHVWVEANIEGAGWIPFDPTPDRSKVPQTEVPKPKPKPRPQVEPPPDPPEQPPRDPVVQDPDAAKEDEKFVLPSWIGAVAMALGGGLVAAAPFVGIVWFKKRRRARRFGADDQQVRLVGGWDEVVDSARDLGARPSATMTRQETAEHLGIAFPGTALGQLAASVDAGDFGPGSLPPDRVDAVWAQADAGAASLRAGVPWYRRALAAVSLRSIIGGRPAFIWSAKGLVHRLGAAGLQRWAELRRVP